MATDLNEFLKLGRADQEAAVRQLAASGMAESTIAQATGLAPEAVRQLLSAATAGSSGEKP